MTARITVSSENHELYCSGHWVMANILDLKKQWQRLGLQSTQIAVIQANDIEAMDSAGAMLLAELLRQFPPDSLTVQGLNKKYQGLLSIVSAEMAVTTDNAINRHRYPNELAIIGHWFIAKIERILAFLFFVGEVASSLWYQLKQPWRLYWRGVVQGIDDIGYRALPIVGLLLFLVGIVLTYQIALQLETYGANIYIVELTGMIIFREFGPLVTAIIAAGRTSTALTAQIGTMKVNEELDALQTMGVSPIVRLVIPKIIATVIALPLVTIWADIFGILGGMFMSKAILSMNYYVFLNRFQHTVPLEDLIVGLIKVPVFAGIIGTVGCFQGFQAAMSADSVGKKTTQSAVQSIFLIIIADALFSIIFSIRGI